MATVYQLIILPSAERDVRSLPKAPLQRILQRIYRLPENPRPPGCKKMTDREGYRVRQGHYRILYEVDDENRTVTIVRVGHRREVYR